MVPLPREILGVLQLVEEVFSERVWDWVQVLVVGAILTPGSSDGGSDAAGHGVE